MCVGGVAIKSFQKDIVSARFLLVASDRKLNLNLQPRDSLSDSDFLHILALHSLCWLYSWTLCVGICSSSGRHLGNTEFKGVS